MNIQDITEPNKYRYSRTVGGRTISGIGRVIQRYKAANGWQIIVHDEKNQRAPTLRPAHILGPVRVRVR